MFLAGVIIAARCELAPLPASVAAGTALPRQNSGDNASLMAAMGGMGGGELPSSQGLQGSLAQARPLRSVDFLGVHTHALFDLSPYLRSHLLLDQKTSQLSALQCRWCSPDPAHCLCSALHPFQFGHVSETRIRYCMYT